MKWIFHEREARMIYSLTTDRQAVIYWEINHLLERLYFDSYTQEKTKGKLSFRYCQFSAITRQDIPQKKLTVMEAFKCFYVYFVSFYAR